MKKIKALLIGYITLSFLNGCIFIPEDYDLVQTYKDAELSVYINKINDTYFQEDLTRMSGWEIDSTLPDHQSGLCLGEPDHKNKTYTKRILINPIYWDHYTELERETLITHEMLHCLYDVGHTDTDDAHLMHTHTHKSVQRVLELGLEEAILEVIEDFKKGLVSN